MKTKIKIIFSAITSLTILFFFFSAQYSKAQVKDLEVYYFDVGQGDSIFIRTPSGKDVLIDGGPDNKVLERIGETIPFWDKKIDLVFLTHAHDDHIAGLYDVLKNYNIGKVLKSDMLVEPENEKYLDSIAKSRDVAEEDLISGEKIILENDVYIDVIYPPSVDENIENINDSSLVLILNYSGKKFMLTGDATSEVESKIINQDLKSDFLKVGHHGSRYSSSEKFLEKVQPVLSIISVGEGNSFGHPTQDTLNRLVNIGSKILRTDKNGTIKIDVKNNGDYFLACSKRCD